ncbi:hypothetical protein U1Q18_010012 [Sarracenia purpurea var. burkii]
MDASCSGYQTCLMFRLDSSMFQRFRVCKLWVEDDGTARALVRVGFHNQIWAGFVAATVSSTYTLGQLDSANGARMSWCGIFSGQALSGSAIFMGQPLVFSFSSKLRVEFWLLKEAEAELTLKKIQELAKAELATAIASEKASLIVKMAEANLHV